MDSRGSEIPDGAASVTPGLYLVATPIGNADDITLRALHVLRAADVVACEDTRHTGRLMQRYGISTRLLPYHDHNADAARPRLLARLAEGATVALVSDAGTPLVSDPGFKLVREARAQGSAVTAIPGACAAVMALQLSGLPPDRFMFAGFLPPRRSARRAALAEVKDVPATLLFYESPNRLAEALGDMAEVLGDRPAAVARELTKLFEEVAEGTLTELAARYAGEPPKGEIVVAVGGPAADTLETVDVDAMLASALAGSSVRDAAAAVAEATGLPKREIYARALALGRGD